MNNVLAFKPEPQQTKLSREEWLTLCADMIMDEIIAPYYQPRTEMSIKISVGYAPNTRMNSRKVGVCFASRASSAGFNEIFISPEIQDSLFVLQVLIHECIHAVDDCENGHKGRFKDIFRAVGLTGKTTECGASESLQLKLSEYIDLFGDMPHAKIETSEIPKQVARNLKVACDCGFKCNTSMTQYTSVIEQQGLFQCPACLGVATLQN